MLGGGGGSYFFTEQYIFKKKPKTGYSYFFAEQYFFKKKPKTDYIELSTRKIQMFSSWMIFLSWRNYSQLWFNWTE